MMKKYLLTATLFLGFVGAFAQNGHEKCGANIVLQKELEDAENRAKYEAFQEAIQRYTVDPRVAVTRENGVRIIPVVFHILHEGGSENISNAKVMTQLEVLNEDYRRLNPDTVNTPERFYGDTEYTHFAFNSNAIADFVDDSAYVRLNNRYGESFAFHFNNGGESFTDSLAGDFDNVIEVNVSASPDTGEIASALADAIDAQNGLIAEYSRDTTFVQAPNFTVDGSQQPTLSYTSEHTFTTSWSGTDTDTIWSDTLTVALYENASDPFEETSTLLVFPAGITYDVFDGSGNVINTQGFTEEGNLVLDFTAVPIAFGDYEVSVATDGLGYADDVLLSGLWHITSTIVQQGKYVPADCDIEFRLATKDPLGNCTDGIVRLFTSKTNDANNGTGFKAESYWNAYSYLNVWVVNNIDMDLGNGTVLGYAQFPASGLLSTDGIALRADNVDERDQGGRTATHEVGHWLSLIHIWGDQQCGSDNVLDTPIHNGPNFGICGNATGNSTATAYHDVPYHVPGCDPDNPDGEMFDNYMDYSDDACMNIFTLGQKARMDYTLHGDGIEPGIRSYLISQENLEATGVADPYTSSDCAPVSDFYFQQSGDIATQKMICVGEDIRFYESAYNGTVDDFDWFFDGGEPSTSIDDNPQVTYNTAGIYDVTLAVSNAQGNSSYTQDDMVIVSSIAAENQSSWGYVDAFWSEQDFLDDYYVFNQDGSDNKWEWYYGENGGSSGWESVRLYNLDNNLGEVDELISPSYNLSTLNSPSLQFRYSGAALDNTPDDELRVMVSKDCGESWSTRETISGFELTNAGMVAESYRPSANSTWTDVDVSLGTFASKENVRVKFRWVSGERSNNFYIDDVTIAGGLIGMEDLEDIIGLNIAPNPTTGFTSVTMNLKDPSHVQMELVDVLGREVKQIFSREMSNGSHKYDLDLSSFNTGVYFLRIQVGEDMLMKKVVKN